jgi:hypothetical protein
MQPISRFRDPGTSIHDLDLDTTSSIDRSTTTTHPDSDDETRFVHRPSSSFCAPSQETPRSKASERKAVGRDTHCSSHTTFIARLAVLQTRRAHLVAKLMLADNSYE